MPDVREVYEMVTKQKPSDPGALERQRTRQIRTIRNRKVGAFAIAAAIGAAAVAVIVATGGPDDGRAPGDEPPTTTTAPDAAVPAGTVTSDGSTCSMEITADRIEPGVVLFDVVNTSDDSVMFDSWQILDGYTFQEFEAVAGRTRRLLENGKPYPARSFFPDQETEVRYLRSDVIPANSSGRIVTTMSAGTHAIACLQRYEGAHRSLRGFQMFGISGPIDVR